jgi:hypothetical protein
MINGPSSPESSPSSKQIEVPRVPTNNLSAPIPKCFVGFGAEPKQSHDTEPSTGLREINTGHQTMYPDQDANGIPTRG